MASSLEPDQVWSAALGELKGSLDERLFDTWLSRSQVLTAADGQMVIALHSDQARAWVEGRLRSAIEGAVQRAAGAHVGVGFVVAPRAATATPDPAALHAPGPGAPEYDVHEAGWFPIAVYECQFWAPVLGRVAWRVWEIVRESDTRKAKTMWTPARRWTAPELARAVPCGRQAIVGVARPGRHQAGAFERMTGLGVATVEREGVEPHIVYTLSVRVRLGLVPAGLATEMNEELQVRHDRWLELHGLDVAAYRRAVEPT